jgi:hypothetical protein
MLPCFLESESEYRRTKGFARSVDFMYSNRKLLKIKAPMALQSISDHRPIVCRMKGVRLTKEPKNLPSSTNFRR